MDHRPPRPDQPYAWDDERLSAYLDGELSAPEQSQLEARLVVDPELRQLVDELRAVRQQLEVLPEYRLQPTFADQVLRRAEQEMLLSPLDRATAAALEPAVAPLSSAKPAGSQAIVTLPARAASRRWQRGAIWTAIAAAAVLLLMVTNRPHAPQQEHVARHELPAAATPKPAAANPEAETAASPAVSDNLHKRNAAVAKESEQEGLGKSGETVPQLIPFGDLFPSVTTTAGATGNQPADAALPKPGAGVNLKPEASPAAAAAQGDKLATNQPKDSDRKLDRDQNQSAGASGKPLLKSLASDQLKGSPQKQAAASSAPISAELSALLASEEFSRLAAEGKELADNTADQVLVVYLTPRQDQRGERSFETLLANNSIALADKPLIPLAAKQLQSSFALSDLNGQPAEPKTKAPAKNELRADSKSRRKEATRDDGKTDHLSNSPGPRTGTPPADDATAVASKTSPASELYYLEADESQVADLLRQLRTPNTQFSRFDIASRPLNQPESLTQGQTETSEAEKSQAQQSAVVAPAAEALAAGSPADEMRLNRTQQYNKQPAAEFNQLAQRAAPAPASASVPPAGAELPSVPALAAPAPGVPAPTASAPTASAPTASAPAMPFALPAPVTPHEIAAPAALANNAAPATTEAKSFSDANGGFGQNDYSNRGALKDGKNPQDPSSHRAIAYRLRGVEALLLAKNQQLSLSAAGDEQRFGVGGGGAANYAKADSDNQKNAADAKSGNRGKTSPSAARRESQPQTSDQKPAEPSADPAANSAPDHFAEKKLEQSPPKSEASDTREPELTLSEKQQRTIERAKAAGNAEQLPLSEGSDAPASSALRGAAPAQKESAKKAAPAPAAKRVRVLFVIEREATME